MGFPQSAKIFSVGNRPRVAGGDERPLNLKARSYIRFDFFGEVEDLPVIDGGFSLIHLSCDPGSGIL